MFGTDWLSYFEANARSDGAPAPSLRAEVPEALRAPLSLSLGRFQLGESAGGRIHDEIRHHADPVLDPCVRRAVQLYIEEEWRHARELASVIHALGGQLQRAHWTNGAFTACRRLLGLRTKMMTLAVAEVVGIVYYRALAQAVGSRTLAACLERIADEESRHLDFQAAFFARAVALKPRWLRGLYRRVLRTLLSVLLLAAVGILILDHRPVLRATGVKLSRLARSCRDELASRRFLAPAARARDRVRPRALRAA